MAKYIYKGIEDKSSSITRGEMSVSGINELEAQLTKLGITLINYSIKKEASIEFSFLDKISTRDIITFFSHLEQLDNAGVSIIDSLKDIKSSKSYPVKIRNLTQDIYESVKNGNLLSESIAQHPKIFPEIFIGLIANGEEVGNLGMSFQAIITNLKWSDAIKSKTTKAIRYPLFSMFIMLIVVMVMTNFVVPQVTSFLRDQKIELPAITTALIAFSEFMQSYSLLILISIPILIIIYKFLRRIPKFALQADELKLKIPIFGSILTKISASRFCNFFSVTFEGGVGMMDCLESTKKVLINLSMKESVDIIKQKVLEGRSLAESIEASGHFPGLVIRMFKVGEDSGNMKKALDNIKFFYDKEIDESIDRIVGMIQPTMVFIMGGLMLWITAAIFGPIYSTFAM